MKIRTYKARVNNMLNWYTEQVVQRMAEDFLSPATPAGFEIAKRYLAEIQDRQNKKESMLVPEWQFPVEPFVTYQVLSQALPPMPVLRVRLVEDWERDNVLYLDFDTVK